MQLSDVYLGLGGNIGDSKVVIGQALKLIEQHPCINNLKTSRFYKTSPVSHIPQKGYINAVCCFKTSLTAKELLRYLQLVERRLGKTPKAKDAPRIIDLDILLFGKEHHNDNELSVPHPKWQERLFVLVPLADVVKNVEIPDANGCRLVDVESLIRGFPNPHNEIITSME